MAVHHSVLNISHDQRLILVLLKKVKPHFQHFYRQILSIPRLSRADRVMYVGQQNISHSLAYIHCVLFNLHDMIV